MVRQRAIFFLLYLKEAKQRTLAQNQEGLLGVFNFKCL